MRDREHVGDQLVGSCLISTEQLVDGQPLEGWWDIVVGNGSRTKGAIHIMAQFFPIGSLNDTSNFLPDSYFEPKTDNQLTLYMTAECPQLPVFDGVTEPDGSPFQANRCWLDIYKAGLLGTVDHIKGMYIVYPSFFLILGKTFLLSE